MSTIFRPPPFRPLYQQPPRLLTLGEGFFYDSLTGANGSDLTAHVGEKGAVWTKHPLFSGAIVFSDANRIRSASTGTVGERRYLASVVPPSPDYAISVPFFNKSAGNGTAYIGARLDPTANTGYFAGHAGSSNTWSIFKYVAGVFGSLGSVVQAISDETAADAVFRLTGPSLELIVDGVSLLSVTDDAIAAAGRIGVALFNQMSNTVGLHIERISAMRIFTATNVEYYEGDLDDPLPEGAEFLTDEGFSFHYKYRKDAAGGETVDVEIELREDVAGEPQIRASRSHTNISDTETEATQPIDDLEWAAVVDPNELYFRIIETRHLGGAVRHVVVDDIYLETPAYNVNATGSGTFGALTAAATGELPIKGTATIAFGALTSSGAGKIAITGVGAGTFGALTASGTGKLAGSGQGAGSFGALTGSGTGTLAAEGSGGGTFGALIGSGSAKLLIQGSGGGSFGALQGAGAGQAGEFIEGAGAGSFGALTASGTGALRIQAVGSGSFGALTASGTGTSGHTGQADASFGALTGSGQGKITIRATGSGSFGALTSSATGSVIISGAASVSFQALEGSGTATLSIAGQGSGVFGALESSGIGRLKITGSGAGSFGALTMTGTGMKPLGKVFQVEGLFVEHRYAATLTVTPGA